jgi:predicted outer membrane lipoprotein
MIRLVRLYPKRWRDRYGAELEQLIRDVGPSGSRRRLAIDLVRGALSAHLHQGIPLANVTRRVIARVAAIVGVVWLLLSTEILLSNVVFPSNSDDDGLAVLASYLGVFAALFLSGLLASRAGAKRKGQVLAGLVAGMLIGLLTAASFAVVDNVWLDVVARQHTKVEAFARSNAASMRDFINQGLIGVAVFLTVGFGAIGALLGFMGGLARETSMGPHRNVPGTS